MPKTSVSPLVIAALTYRNAKAVRILRHHPNQAFEIHQRTQNTTLHIFVRNDAVEVVKLLLRAGVSVAALNDQKELALHRAKSSAVVRLLLTHGSHVHVNCSTKYGYDVPPCSVDCRTGD